MLESQFRLTYSMLMNLLRVVKGQVACEIHTHEVIITELLFRNFLSEFEPSEIAALLSCMVLQVRDYMYT